MWLLCSDWVRFIAELRVMSAHTLTCVAQASLIDFAFTWSLHPFKGNVAVIIACTISPPTLLTPPSTPLPLVCFPPPTIAFKVRQIK